MSKGAVESGLWVISESVAHEIFSSRLCTPCRVNQAFGDLALQDGELQGSPKGLFAVEAAELKPCLDAVHGNALGVAALLVAAAR